MMEDDRLGSSQPPIKKPKEEAQKMDDELCDDELCDDELLDSFSQTDGDMAII